MITDPWQFRRKQRSIVKRTFQDAEAEQEVTLSLRKLDVAEATIAFQTSAEYARRFIIDKEVEFPLVGNEPVELSNTLFSMIATLYTMQQPEKTYTIEDLVAISVTFTPWSDIMVWMNEIQEGKPPNA